MKTPAAILLGASLVWIPTLAADPFSSGSTGALGALSVTADTVIDLPANGILNYTTITVASGATVTFNRNALNTPVTMLATGDVNIAGTIDVSGTGATVTGGLYGLGGPGGFDGGVSGRSGVSPLPGGNGKGPGGGKHGVFSNQGNDLLTYGPGGYGTRHTNQYFVNAGSGAIYGSPLLLPLIGGSGGSGIDNISAQGGGGGGGAILVSSSTRVVVASTGRIRANGGVYTREYYGTTNSGSGGAVRLVAPLVLGNGTVEVQSGGGAGAAGRVRIDSTYRFNAAVPTDKLEIIVNPTEVASYGSYMVVSPENPPALAITQAAGQAIADGVSTGVTVNLPFNASPTTTVVVRAQHFNGVVPIRVVLTPDNGDIITYDAEIDNTSTNPASTTVNVVLPVNINVDIAVWTR